MQGMKNMNNNNQHKVYTDQLILFIGMFFIALIFDMMNVMVNSVNDLYLSKPLICSALYMASTMLWGHQIIHYIQTGRKHFNTTIFSSCRFFSLSHSPIRVSIFINVFLSFSLLSLDFKTSIK